MKPSNVLEDAKALIKDPKHWTQGVHARDKYENSVSSFSDKAVCFCSLGALRRVVHGTINKGVPGALIIDAVTDSWLYSKSFEYLNQTVHKDLRGKGGIAIFNDGSIHDQVLSMFDKAIVLAKAEENARQT